jgi:hypothetical protein
MLWPICHYRIMAASGHFEFWKSAFSAYHQLIPCVKLHGCVKFHPYQTYLLLIAHISCIYDTTCTKHLHIDSHTGGHIGFWQPFWKWHFLIFFINVLQTKIPIHQYFIFYSRDNITGFIAILFFVFIFLTHFLAHSLVKLWRKFFLRLEIFKFQ